MESIEQLLRVVADLRRFCDGEQSPIPSLTPSDEIGAEELEQVWAARDMKMYKDAGDVGRQ